MKPETKIPLIRKLKKIKPFKNKNNYKITWYILVATAISTAISITSLVKFISFSIWFLYLSIITFLSLFIPILQTHFVIIRFRTDKKLQIVLEALLNRESE